ncbi:hypothetical protein SpCBS45565_g04174 [Spizellomyces sp. 'palustris']|nr:hypothetical protein SpCBS45565_g04174 [Spizellomyces sp. 'palustris']
MDEVGVRSRPGSAGSSTSSPEPSARVSVTEKYVASAAVPSANIPIDTGRRPSTSALVNRVRRASLAARPDTFMTVIHSATLMNAATNEETAISKAVFYDRMLETLDDGMDEGRALAEAVRAAKEAGASASKRKAGGGTDTNPTAASLPSAPQRIASTTEAPIPVTGEKAENVDRASAAANDDNVPDPGNVSPGGSQPATPAPSRPATPSAGSRKLKGLFNTIIKPSLEKQSRDPAPTSTSQGVSIAKLRMIHRRLMLSVDEYDAITFGEAFDREKSMLESSRAAVQKAKDETRRAIIEEYEKRIKHDNCNAKISVLERENHIMKDETARTMGVNRELTQEITALRLFKSTAEAEQALMVDELARRRLQTRAIRKRLKKALQRIHELDVQLQASTGGPNSCIKGKNQRKASSTTAASRNTKHGSTESTEYDLEIKSTEEATTDDDKIIDAEWEEWCRTTHFTQPKWNQSTSTKALSGDAPPSVIHTGDGDGLLNSTDDERTSSPTKDTHQGKDIQTRRPKRRRQLAEHRRQAKLVTRLTDVLEECFTGKQEEQGHAELATDSTQKLIDDSTSAGMDRTLIDRLVSHESLIRQLLSGLKSYMSPIVWASSGDDTDGRMSVSDSAETSGSEKLSRTASKRRTRRNSTANPASRPCTPRTGSASPMTGVGAGVCERDALKRPADFGRPAKIQEIIREVETKAAHAAKAVGLMSAQISGKHEPSALLDCTSSVPPPSHGERAAGFGDIRQWLQRASSRPKSAPTSRHGVPGGAFAQGNLRNGSWGDEWDETDVTEGQCPTGKSETDQPKGMVGAVGISIGISDKDCKAGASDMTTIGRSVTPKPAWGDVPDHRSRPASAFIPSASPGKHRPEDDSRKRHVRPMSAPVRSRAGGMAGGGLLVGRAHPRPKLSRPNTFNVTVNGRHIG